MKNENLEFEEATNRGRETLASSPNAQSVSYNVKTKRIVIELESGVTAIIPAGLIQILQGATAEQIKDVEIAVEGLYLRWTSLDEDLFLPNLLQGVFGTQKWMSGLKEHLSSAGKKGGAARTEVKQKSSAENGKKGGRPRKTNVA